MSRHASAEDLASYLEGILKPRKAARIAAHLVGCAQCNELLQELQTVPAVLSSARYPPIPNYLSVRIELAIATESAARVASQPASEADRRDLPARARPQRRGWRLPGMSSPVALRVLAAAGAAVIVAGGGYELATHTGGSGSGSSTSQGAAAGSQHAAGNLAPQRLGANFSYKHDGHTDTIQMVSSSTDFQPANFRSQALAALHASQKTPGTGASASAPSTLSPAPFANGQIAPSMPVPELDKLRGCVDVIAAGRSLLLVEVAKYKGAPATIIIVGPTAKGPAEAFALGSGCSATHRSVLFSAALPGL